MMAVLAAQPGIFIELEDHQCGCFASGLSGSV